jgi:uncharacterized RDD family membrane protein YckC
VSQVVTGNAVLLELRPARMASRSLAILIDLVVMGAGFAGLLFALAAAGAFTGFDQALMAATGVVVLLTVFVVYPVTFETLTRGRSLGKLVMGLRVVREDGGPIRFRQALARGLAGFIVDFGLLSAFLGIIGIISSLASQRGRRIGDLLAGTIVVQERLPRSRATEITMPPSLAGWAATLSLSQLPDDLALRARQFLHRVRSLDPKVRAELGESLATAVAAATGPAPPPGTAPEAYLAAVLAERARREGERLAAHRAAAGTTDPTSAPADTTGAPTPDPDPSLAPGPAATGPDPADPVAARWGGTRADGRNTPPDDGFALPR